MGSIQRYQQQPGDGGYITPTQVIEALPVHQRNNERIINAIMEVRHDQAALAQMMSLALAQHQKAIENIDSRLAQLEQQNGGGIQLHQPYHTGLGHTNQMGWDVQQYAPRMGGGQPMISSGRDTRINVRINNYGRPEPCHPVVGVVFLLGIMVAAALTFGAAQTNHVIQSAPAGVGQPPRR